MDDDDGGLLSMVMNVDSGEGRLSMLMVDDDDR